MSFFTPDGTSITWQQWQIIFRHYYFLTGPTHGRRIDKRRQSSAWVEDKVVGLLSQAQPLNQQDWTLAMAWKIGLVDHSQSDKTQNIHYRPSTWPSQLIAPTRYRDLDFSQSIPFLAANMANIRQGLASNPDHLFKLLVYQRPRQGFGPVYALTATFFATGGREPIYDKWAHIGALAIDNNLLPGAKVNHRAAQSWNDYNNYKALLRKIGLRQEDAMFISRDDDRALWVYGHFFTA